MREFRFLDEKRKTNGLMPNEEQRWYELAAQLGVDMSQYGQWGADGQWYPYPPGYDPNQQWGQQQQPGYYDPNQAPQQEWYGQQQQPAYYDPNQPAYDPNQPAYDPNQPAYAPSQPAYDPSQPAYDPSQPAYAPSQPGYDPSQPAYDPNQQPGYGYAPQPGYPTPYAQPYQVQPQYPPQQGWYGQPPQPGYFPPNEQGYANPPPAYSAPEPQRTWPQPAPYQAPAPTWPAPAVPSSSPPRAVVGGEEVMEISDEEVAPIPTAPPAQARAQSAVPPLNLRIPEDPVADLRSALLDDEDGGPTAPPRAATAPPAASPPPPIKIPAMPLFGGAGFSKASAPEAPYKVEATAVSSLLPAPADELPLVSAHDQSSATQLEVAAVHALSRLPSVDDVPETSISGSTEVADVELAGADAQSSPLIADLSAGPESVTDVLPDLPMLGSTKAPPLDSGSSDGPVIDPTPSMMVDVASDGPIIDPTPSMMFEPSETGTLLGGAVQAQRLAEEARLAEEERQAAEAARLAEAARAAEEQRQAAEAVRLAEAARAAEEERQAAEAVRLAEVARVAEEERQAAEAVRLAEEERLAEAQRQAEAARIAEEQRQVAEAVRLAEEARLVEEQRQAARVAEEARRAEEERERLEEEQRFVALQRRAEEEARQQAEEAQRFEALQRAARDEEQRRREEEDRIAAEAQRAAAAAQRAALERVAEDQARQENEAARVTEARRLLAQEEAIEAQERRDAEEEAELLERAARVRETSLLARLKEESDPRQSAAPLSGGAPSPLAPRPMQEVVGGGNPEDKALLARHRQQSELVRQMNEALKRSVSEPSPVPTSPEPTRRSEERTEPASHLPAAPPARVFGGDQTADDGDLWNMVQPVSTSAPVPGNSESFEAVLRRVDSSLEALVGLPALGQQVAPVEPLPHAALPLLTESPPLLDVPVVDAAPVVEAALGVEATPASEEAPIVEASAFEEAPIVAAASSFGTEPTSAAVADAGAAFDVDPIDVGSFEPAATVPVPLVDTAPVAEASFDVSMTSDDAPADSNWTEVVEASRAPAPSFAPSDDDLPVLDLTVEAQPEGSGVEASLGELPVVGGEALNPSSPASAFDALAIPPPPPASSPGAALRTDAVVSRWESPAPTAGSDDWSAALETAPPAATEVFASNWDDPLPVETGPTAAASLAHDSPWEADVAPPAADRSRFGGVNPEDQVQLASNADFMPGGVANELGAMDVGDVSVTSEPFEVESGPAASLANAIPMSTESSIEEGQLELSSNADFLDATALTSTGESWQRSGAAIEVEPEIIQGVVVEEEAPSGPAQWDAEIPVAPAPAPLNTRVAVPAAPASFVPPRPASAPAPVAAPAQAVMPVHPSARVIADELFDRSGTVKSSGPVVISGEYRVILHTMEGQVKRGVLKDPDLGAESISLEGPTGGVEGIALGRVKAIFFMLAPGARSPPSTGQKVRVTFKDGRQVAGFSSDHGQRGPGFFVVPADNRTNTERIYIYRLGVQTVSIES